MKKILLTAASSLALLTSVHAQIFYPTNLVVARFSGQTSSSLGGAAIDLDEYTTNGTLLTTFAVPTSGANATINVATGAGGALTQNLPDTQLVFAGYSSALPYAGQLDFSTVPRVAATVDAYGNFALPIKTTSIFPGFIIYSAASDGTNYWVDGSGPAVNGIYPQVVYAGTAATPANVSVATNVFGTSKNNAVNLYNVNGTYQLMVSGTTTNTAYSTTVDGIGTFILSNLSGALPLSGTATSNYFPLGKSGVNPYDITINPAGTIAYVADDDIGIIKFSYNGSAWVSNYTISVTNISATPSLNRTSTTLFDETAVSVTADWTQTPPVVYAISGESLTNRLVSFVDTNSSGIDYITALAYGNVTTGAGGVTNTFRSIRFAPQLYAYISVPPVAFTGLPGATATFSATVLGSPAPTMQWYSNSPANPTYVAIPGATAANLNLASINLSQSGSLFYLVVSNIYGVTQSTPVALTVENPAIGTEPIGATNLVGSPGTTLSVSALGTPTPSLQWYSNGVAISGATTSTYTTPSFGVSNSVSYTVVVSNSSGSVTSTPAIVYFTPYLLFDTFSYPNGNLFADAGSSWTDINGTNAELVNNGMVQVSQTNATTDGQELFITNLSQANATTVWASFTVNFTSLPTNAGGVYFANLENTNFGFYASVYALTTNAYPGTYRLGISETNADFVPATGKNGPTAVVPVDLALGVTYQVVYMFDMTGNNVTYMQVNPNVTNDVDFNSFINDPLSVYTTDQQLPTNGLQAFGLRQRPGEGALYLDNLKVAADMTVGSATINGYQAVTAGTVPQAPVIGFQPASFTNYVGNSNTLKVAASAIGSGINPQYYWYHNTSLIAADGGDYTGSASDTLTINPEASGDAGTYYCIVSNAIGIAQSSNAIVTIISTPTAPFFVSPTNSSTNTLAEGSSISYSALAEGTGPITYEWYLNGSDTGVSGPALNLSSFSTNQGGTYTVVATGAVGSPVTDTNVFILNVTGPLSTNIAYLRSLLVTSSAPTNITSSDTTTLFNVTGVVTVLSNLTSGSTASIYIQDATGGINYFINDPTFRPYLGEIITATGTLDIYNNNLELYGTFGNPYDLNEVISSNNPTPAPVVLPWGLATANPGYVAQYLCGEMVTVTNAYFEAYVPGTNVQVFAAGDSYTITNTAGQSYIMYLNTQDTTLSGTPIPQFAYSVSGPLVQYNSSFEIYSTYLSEIVTTPPPATTVSAALSGTNLSLSWTAVPTYYSYTVRASTNVAGPYVPVASGMVFTNTNAVLSNLPATNATMFYEIVSP